jgi:hypothetical protein
LINIRQKGAEGEREIIKLLDPIIKRVALEHGYDISSASVQRNQNQTAVGGCDLSNTFGCAIEVKRQEQLAINTWWEQCLAQAKRNNEIPVLLFRQNQKKWRCIMDGAIMVLDSTSPSGLSPVWVRVEVSIDDFLVWFELHVHKRMAEGDRPRT